MSNPIVCVKCREAMICVENGTVVRWQKRWCKKGDKYECTGCGSQVVLIPTGAGGYTDQSDIILNSVVDVED